MNWIRQVLKKPRICGQALVEVLLAMSILVSSFIGLLSVQLQSSEWVADSRALTRAGFISFSFLEALRGGSLAVDWDLLDEGEWVDLKDAGGGFPLERMKDQKVYVKAEKAEAGLYQIGVKTEWKRRNGKSSVEIYTKIREAALKSNFGH